MTLDFEGCYRAVAARDSRFDGRFFTGVTSTGIYCRPICPARTPSRRNVRFFRHAAGAEAAGFRPCRRCRPEVSPDSPHWAVRATLVERALRWINEGIADEEGVGGLARRLHVTDRHLHRLFVAELGAGPLAVVRTRRLQLARRLLVETALPVTEVAYASGFGSIRQFNATMRQAYGVTPSELRRTPANGSAGLTIRLSYRPPCDTETLLDFFAARAIPGVEEVAGKPSSEESGEFGHGGPGRYSRTVRSASGVGVVELTPEDGHVALRAEIDDVRGTGQLVACCRRLFDLDADPQAVEDAFGSDPTLGSLVRDRPGLRVPGAWDGFEAAVRAVVGQQVSVAAARTLLGRLVHRAGKPLDRPVGTLTHLFPTPDELATADLGGLGLTGARINTVHALAEALASGSLDLSSGADPAETTAVLTSLPGIGPWTASYVAMRGLRDPDAFPAGDLGIRRALERLGVPLSAAERWRPWRAYAAMYLWTQPKVRTDP